MPRSKSAFGRARNDGREVEHAVGAGHGARHERRVADVANGASHALHRRCGNLVDRDDFRDRTAFAGRVRQRAPLQQFADQSLAQETGAAGDDYLHGLLLSTPASAARAPRAGRKTDASS